MRNRRPDLNGLLVIDKPLGWSSAKVCAFVRRHTGGAKVGHAGTLDPLATGVLVLALGRATKAIPQLMATTKRYAAEVDLSAFTTTDDAEGERDEIAVRNPPTRETIERTLSERFTGTITQIPPIYSAVKIEGERAYRLARAGRGGEGAAKLKPRDITIHAIELTDYTWPTAAIDIACSKGTYIRSLARDLGLALGTGGTLAALRRTDVGDYTLDSALTPTALPDPLTAKDLLLIPS